MPHGMSKEQGLDFCSPCKEQGLGVRSPCHTVQGLGTNPQDRRANNHITRAAAIAGQICPATPNP
jgi:hypothetical protein